MASKAVERAVLAMCVERILGFPASPAADHEHPDFLVATGDRRVGIEMQEFIQGATSEGAPKREGESLRALTMELAQKQFEKAHQSTFLYVYGHWSRSSALDRRTVRNVAHKLATLVDNLVPPPPGAGQGMSRRDASYEELEKAGIAELLLRLDVSLFPPATFGVWSSPEGGHYSRDLADLKNQIHDKDGKLSLYRESCSEVWLVMYSLALPSGAFDMEALSGEWVESPFDHVVFLEAVSGNYALLPG